MKRTTLAILAVASCVVLGCSLSIAFVMLRSRATEEPSLPRPAWLLGTWDRDLAWELTNGRPPGMVLSRARIARVRTEIAVDGARTGIAFQADGSGSEWAEFGGDRQMDSFAWRVVDLQGGTAVVAISVETRGHKAKRTFRLDGADVLIEERESGMLWRYVRRPLTTEESKDEQSLDDTDAGAAISATAEAFAALENVEASDDGILCGDDGLTSADFANGTACLKVVAIADAKPESIPRYFDAILVPQTELAQGGLGYAREWGKDELDWLSDLAVRSTTVPVGGANTFMDVKEGPYFVIYRCDQAIGAREAKKSYVLELDLVANATLDRDL